MKNIFLSAWEVFNKKKKGKPFILIKEHFIVA